MTNATSEAIPVECEAYAKFHESNGTCVRDHFYNVYSDTAQTSTLINFQPTKNIFSNFSLLIIQFFPFYIYSTRGSILEQKNIFKRDNGVRTLDKDVIFKRRTECI
jgi:hypothetical protein